MCEILLGGLSVLLNVPKALLQLYYDMGRHKNKLQLYQYNAVPKKHVCRCPAAGVSCTLQVALPCLANLSYARRGESMQLKEVQRPFDRDDIAAA